MERRELQLEADVQSDALDAWVSAGWLIPRHNGKSPSFQEIDLARVHLIHDLQVMGVNEEAIPIILGLVDQLYGLRGAFRTLLAEIAATASTRR